MAVDYDLVELSPQATAVVRTRTTIDEISTFFDKAFHAIMAQLTAEGIQPVGPPFGYYPAQPAGTFELAAGFPVASPITGNDEVEPDELPGGRAVVAIHLGPYETMEATYTDLIATLGADGVELAGNMWEVYLTDPSAEKDPSHWKTRIVWPTARSRRR